MATEKLDDVVYNPKVCRKPTSIAGIGMTPMTRSIAALAMVAMLSVITTESVSKPDC